MTRALTTKEWISRAKAKFGSKYNYSKTKYVDSKTKIVIICPIHGEQLMIPHHHLKGYGCAKCGRQSAVQKRSMTNEEWIEKAKKKWGDKFNYEKTVYKNCSSKLIISCRDHGEFITDADTHIYSKTGCPFCGEELRLKSRSLGTEIFIKRAKKKYSNKYDYSQVKYKNSLTKVKIKCPIHGFFFQNPMVHLHDREGNTGCPKCGREANAISCKKRMLTKEEFLKRSKIIYGDKFEYFLDNWEGTKTKFKYKCPIHGVRSSSVLSHLTVPKEGKTFGCTACAEDYLSSLFSMKFEEFLLKAKKIHGDLYDYSQAGFSRSGAKIKVLCKEKGHGFFYPKAIDHLNGSKCPECAGKRKLTTSQFINRAKLVHGQNYQYEKTEYVNMNSNVIITCPKHGDFYSNPANHLGRKSGCPKCGRETTGRKKARKFDSFMDAAKKRWGNKFDYSETKYKNMDTKITIICPVHNSVEVHPYTFLISMFGCPKCANLFKRPDSINHFQNNRERANSDCELYLVEIDSDHWKIGISSDTDERFRVYIQEILYRRLITRAVAWCVEQYFLTSTEWAKPIILPEKFDDFEGRTEIRNAKFMDIMELADLLDSEIENCEGIGWENYATKKLLSATGYGWNPKDALFVPKI